MANQLQIMSAEDFLKDYDPETKLTSYFSHLKKENRKINLVSRETIDKSLIGIAAASLIPFEIMGQHKISRYLDIGSGGGFPAVPIILTQVMESATLIERKQKKAAALNRMLVALRLCADVLSDSFEALTLKPGYDLITMRLVRLDRSLFDRIVELLAPGGHFVHYSDVDRSFYRNALESSTYCYSIAKPALSGDFTIFKKV